MRECNGADICMTLAAVILALFFSGCAEIPIRDGGLAIGKDTTACIEDLGVASVNNKF